MGASLALAPLLLGGCAPSDHPFPSLAPRAIEKVAPDAPATVAPPPPSVPDATLDAAARDALAAAEASVAPFDAAFAEAGRAMAAARGAAFGSEGWTVAQQALSRLDGARGPATQALATLDRLRADGAARGGVDSAAIDAAWARVAEIEADQRARYGRAAEGLAGG